MCSIVEELYLKIKESDEAAVRYITKVGLQYIQVNTLINKKELTCDFEEVPMVHLLHWAVCQGRSETVKLLLQHPLIDVNILIKTPFRSCSPVSIAATLKDPRILFMLFNAGALIDEYSDPLSRALVAKSFAAAELLCRRGAHFIDTPLLCTLCTSPSYTKFLDLLLREGLGMYECFTRNFFLVIPSKKQFISNNLDSSQWCFFGARDLDRSYRCLENSIFTLEDLQEYRLNCVITGKPDNIPYERLLWRLRHLRTLLKPVEYEKLIPIEQFLENITRDPNRKTLQQLCLKVVAQDPYLRSQVHIDSLKDQLDLIPCPFGNLHPGGELRYLNYLAGKTKNNTARRFGQYLLHYLFGKAYPQCEAPKWEGFVFKAVCVGCSVSLPVLAISYFIASRNFDIVFNTNTSTSVNVDCWYYSSHPEYIPYEDTADYTNFCRVFVPVFDLAFVVLLVCILFTIIMFLLRNRVDHFAYLPLKKFEDLVNRHNTGAPIRIAHRRINEVVESIEQLVDQKVSEGYDIEASNLLPMNTSTHSFFQRNLNQEAPSRGTHVPAKSNTPSFSNFR